MKFVGRCVIVMAKIILAKNLVDSFTATLVGVFDYENEGLGRLCKRTSSVSRNLMALCLLLGIVFLL